MFLDLRPLATVVLAACGVLAACAPDEAPGPEATDPVPDGFPVSVQGPDGAAVEVARPPVRIVPTNGSAADFVLAFVGPERVAALSPVTVAYSPAARAAGSWAGKDTLGKYVGEELLEASPDLVVTHSWQSTAATNVLRNAGVPVLVLDDVKSVDDLHTTFGLLGSLLGEPVRGEQLMLSLEDRMEALAAREPRADDRVIAYSNLGSGGNCSGRGTSFDLVIRVAGLTNLAAEEGIEGHGSMDNELLLTLDPDWLVVSVSTDDPDMNASETYLRTTPSLADLRAVRENRIVRLPAELYTTNSHYLVDAAERLLEELDRR